MLVTVGITTNHKSHKVHRHLNGWAACGAGRLIQSPRPVADGDQLCRRCAKHLHTLLLWEIDDMRRKGCTTLVSMLEKFVDSGKSPAELAERDAFRAKLGARLVARWADQERAKPLPVVDRYAGTLTLF